MAVVLGEADAYLHSGRMKEWDSAAPAAVATAAGLRVSRLDGNQISDLSVLVEMAKKDAEGEKRFAPFWTVTLSGNPLSGAAKDAQLAELTKYSNAVTVTVAK